MGERGIGSQGRLPWQQHDSLAVSLVDVLAVSVPEEPATRFPVPAGLRRAGPRRLLLSQVSSSAAPRLPVAAAPHSSGRGETSVAGE